MKNFTYILRFIKPYKTHVFSITIFLIIFNLFSTVIPYLTFSVIIDKYLPQSDYKMITVIAVLIACLVVAMALIEVFQGYIMSYLGSRVSFDIRQKLFRHLQTLSLKFYTDRHSGEILERLNTDVQGIQDVLTRQVVTMITSLVKFAFLTVAIFLISWQLATPMFIVVLIQFYIFYVVFKKLHGKVHELREGRSKLVGNLQERVSLIKVIQTFTRQKYEQGLHHKKSQKLIRQALNIASTRGQILSVFWFTMDFAPVMVLWLGAYMLINDLIQIGTLMAMWAYSWEFILPIERIVGTLTNFQDSLVGVQRVKAYLDEEPEVKEIAKPIKNKPIYGEIDFKGVNFSYESNKQILFDIDLHINAGETIAFVGESGSGKSTLTNLIFRFYDPDRGKITLDGENLKNYSLKHLRNNIGVVFQDTELFVTTLRDNLAYGARKKVSDEDILRVCEMAQLTEVIEKLPQGLDTMVEEKGTNFSGGEKQRIALARLILRDPKILIFDEATSALDSKSEKMIQDAMDKLMNGPTSIIIAHRLSTVVNADRIYVFRDGRIVEEGSHLKLLADKGEYFSLWQEQLKEEKEEVNV